MKKLITGLMLAFTFSSMATYAVDDKESIKETIQNAVQAANVKDFEAWSRCWVHEAYVSRTYASSLGSVYVKSWDSLATSFKNEMRDEYVEDMKTEIIDQDINIIGDLAVVYVQGKLKSTFYGAEEIYNLAVQYILKKSDGNWKLITLNSINVSTYESTDFAVEMNINVTGYKLLTIKKVDEAIKVFVLNTILYPNAFNTWDSLAEAYMIKGDYKKAVEYYKKSLQLNPKNANAQKMIEKIEKGPILI